MQQSQATKKMFNYSIVLTRSSEEDELDSDSLSGSAAFSNSALDNRHFFEKYSGLYLHHIGRAKIRQRSNKGLQRTGLWILLCTPTFPLPFL